MKNLLFDHVQHALLRKVVAGLIVQFLLAMTVTIDACDGLAVSSWFDFPPNRYRRMRVSCHIARVRDTPEEASTRYARTSLTRFDMDAGGDDSNVVPSSADAEEEIPTSPYADQAAAVPASTTSTLPSSLVSATFHHSAIRTRNITLAIQFYSLFGFEPTVKFKTGPARAAWLEQQRPQQPSPSSSSSSLQDQEPAPPSPTPPLMPSPSSCRIELIEIPPHILMEGSSASGEWTKKRAPDLLARSDLLGHNHLALDVTSSAQQLGCGRNLTAWMGHLNEQSVALFGKTMRVALPPKQLIIGNVVYELAFLYDADGALIELLCQGDTLPQKVSSGWEPISFDDGEDGFWGPKTSPPATI
jgi:hypothetical protein